MKSTKLTALQQLYREVVKLKVTLKVLPQLQVIIIQLQNDVAKLRTTVKHIDETMAQLVNQNPGVPIRPVKRMEFSSIGDEFDFDKNFYEDEESKTSENT